MNEHQRTFPVLQQVAYMSGSKTIVVINKDTEAPVFKLGTCGIVGNLLEVVLELTRTVKSMGLWSIPASSWTRIRARWRKSSKCRSLS